MEITDIRIKKIENEGSLRAVASVTLDHSFAIHDVKIIEGTEKLFVAMPSRKAPGGEYRDIVHPINSEIRSLFEKRVLDAYYAMTGAFEN